MVPRASSQSPGPNGRPSAFREVGLFDDAPSTPPPNYDDLIRTPPTSTSPSNLNASNPARNDRKASRSGAAKIPQIIDEEEDELAEDSSERLLFWRRQESRPWSRKQSIARLVLVAFVVILVIHITPLFGLSMGRWRSWRPGPSAVAPWNRELKNCSNHEAVRNVAPLQKRADSPMEWCKRWAGQSAVINGTLYWYGGRATSSASQTNNQWNNDLITIDLTKSWDIAQPPIAGLPRPAGPPAVSLASLWNSYDSLYLYGGEFSEDPQADPTDFSLWEYGIKGASWKEHKSPKTSAGKNSEPAGQAIARAAEGAGASVPALGRAFYFGGHLDFLTSPSWSITTPRVYLRSFIEYTFPGYSNSGIDTLGDSKTASADGAWRNITQAGIQDTAGFTNRADGVLVWVPGWGDQGIMLSLAGGTNESFTQMNVIDVYDVATSVWYRQSTTGKSPQIRVNPCAVVASAPDGSSQNIYMFGGQNLIPYGSQEQYSDMWILSIPAFRWIQVDTADQAVPYPRAGHTCHIWDSQMIVVGGYVGKDISCEYPGVYVFNTSSLAWSQTFNSLGGGTGDNKLSQQLNQKGAGKDAGLQGSYGYTVPQPVYAAIGGSPTGGATVTAPLVAATGGPLATGKPISYHVGPGDTIVSGDGSNANRGPNVGAIAAGSVAGVLGLVAIYAAFCALLYRKQLALYKSGHAHPLDPEMRSSSVAALWRRSGGVTAAAAHRRDGSWVPASEHAASHAASSDDPDDAAAMKRLSSGGYAAGGHVMGANSSGPYGSRGEGAAAAGGYGGSAGDSQEDLMGGFEPSYWGVLLHPRRSLKIVNR